MIDNINHDLIKMIRELNKMTLLIEERDDKLDQIDELLNDEELENIEKYVDELDNHILKINNDIDNVDNLINEIYKIEPNYLLRTLYFSLVDFLDTENYEKCEEISNIIKNIQLDNK